MLYELLFRRMPLPVALVDRDLTVIDASEAFAELAGVDLASLLGAPLAVAFSNEADAAAVRSAVADGSRFEGTDGVMLGGSAVSIRVIGIDSEAGRALALVGRNGDASNEDRSMADIYAAIRTIKHEINNPLTGALGNINLLLRRPDLDEKARRRLATAEQEIKKVSQIVLRLSELAPTPQAKSTPS